MNSNANDAIAGAGQVDLVVIGGGPTGSTIASLVARQGHSVLVLEKGEHPRFHIGESLLPHNLKILRRLGLAEEMADLGVYKPGVDFTSEALAEESQEIRFADALDLAPGCEHAYQVLRADFDRLLFENAAASGARVMTGARVRDVAFDNPAHALVDFEHAGDRRQVSARFVVDASGRDALLARKFKLQQRNRDHATAALYGHFRNVPRRPGESAGNISLYWFDEGWIWMIPLPNGVMSVGAVCNPDYLRQRGKDVEGFFYATIKRNPHAWHRLAAGELLSSISATGNYSYFSTRLDGPNWLMLGDAGIFIDPVFSSGVFFGMYSAECGTDVVLAELANNAVAARQARRRLRTKIRRGVRELSWFIYRFHAPAMRQMFLRPGDLLQIREAVISVLAGDVHDNQRVIWRVRVFRIIYALVSLRMLPRALREWRKRRRNAKGVFDHAA